MELLCLALAVRGFARCEGLDLRVNSVVAVFCQIVIVLWGQAFIIFLRGICSENFDLP